MIDVSQRNNAEKTPAYIALLDDLIKRHYDRLIAQENEPAKIGDFIKMIELRRKLAPSDAEQQKFWEMLEKVRQQALGEKKEDSARKGRKAGGGRKKRQ